MIRDAILTCTRKPTWVSLIYHTDLIYRTEHDWSTFLLDGCRPCQPTSSVRALYVCMWGIIKLSWLWWHAALCLFRWARLEVVAIVTVETTKHGNWEPSVIFMNVDYSNSRIKHRFELWNVSWFLSILFSHNKIVMEYFIFVHWFSQILIFEL